MHVSFEDMQVAGLVVCWGVLGTPGNRLCTPDLLTASPRDCLQRCCADFSRTSLSCVPACPCACLPLPPYSDSVAPTLKALGLTPLMAAVLVGAAQNVFSKSAKYSLFDPCKEMAYIPLDDEVGLLCYCYLCAIDGAPQILGFSWKRGF